MTVVDRTGRPIAVFGPTIDPNSLDFQRELTRGSSATVLTGRADRYDIEEFTARGQARRLVRRSVAWFPPADISATRPWNPRRWRAPGSCRGGTAWCGTSPR